MKKFLVPFEKQETVWCKYLAPVEAKTAQSALNKIKKIIEMGDSVQANFGYIECEFVEITEHIHSDCKYNIEDYDVRDVVEADERVSCELSLTAFDIARLGKDELYRMAEEKFAKIGLIFEIKEMQMIPIKIEEHFVTYDCIPVDYVQTWSNGDESIVQNNQMITPLHESLLLLNENIMSKACEYNRTTAIKLPASFDIQRIDKRMKELKTNIVTFREKTYIVGVFDGGYALWECEV